MKIKKCKKGFVPFKITIESQEELVNIVAALNSHDEDSFLESKMSSPHPELWGDYNEELDMNMFKVLNKILKKC